MLAAVARDLRRGFGERYRILRATSGAEALELLAEVRRRGDQVALLIADQRMPGMAGTEYLVKARTIVPTGIAVKVPAERGQNQAYVQRLLACQTAQARAVESSGPLAVEGTDTRVILRHGEYEIRLTNDDPARARELQTRMVDGTH